MFRTILMISIVALAGCASGKQAPMLERNLVDVSITYPKECKKKALVQTADGGLWIK